MKRWTIEELSKIDNLEFAKIILSERKNRLAYYTPLVKKLAEAIAELDDIIESRRKNK